MYFLCDVIKSTEYEASHLGGVLGRVANRVAGATFTVGRSTYTLISKSGRNHFNGGSVGFDKVNRLLLLD